MYDCNALHSANRFLSSNRPSVLSKTTWLLMAELANLTLVDSKHKAADRLLHEIKRCVPSLRCAFAIVPCSLRCVAYLYNFFLCLSLFFRFLFLFFLISLSSPFSPSFFPFARIARGCGGPQPCLTPAPSERRCGGRRHRRRHTPRLLSSPSPRARVRHALTPTQPTWTIRSRHTARKASRRRRPALL